MLNLLAHYWQEKQILNLLLVHLHLKSAAHSCSNVSFFLWSRHNHFVLYRADQSTGKSHLSPSTT